MIEYHEPYSTAISHKQDIPQDIYELLNPILHPKGVAVLREVDYNPDSDYTKREETLRAISFKDKSEVFRIETNLQINYNERKDLWVYEQYIECTAMGDILVCSTYLPSNISTKEAQPDGLLKCTNNPNLHKIYNKMREMAIEDRCKFNKALVIGMLKHRQNG